MSSMEQIEAAEAKMNNARNALLSYVESRKPLDRDRYRRLVARVKKAEAQFIKAISQLQ